MCDANNNFTAVFGGMCVCVSDGKNIKCGDFKQLAFLYLIDLELNPSIYTERRITQRDLHSTAVGKRFFTLRRLNTKKNEMNNVCTIYTIANTIWLTSNSGERMFSNIPPKPHVLCVDILYWWRIASADRPLTDSAWNAELWRSNIKASKCIKQSKCMKHSKCIKQSKAKLS